MADDYAFKGAALAKSERDKAPAGAPEPTAAPVPAESDEVSFSSRCNNSPSFGSFLDLLKLTTAQSLLSLSFY